MFFDEELELAYQEGKVKGVTLKLIEKIKSLDEGYFAQQIKQVDNSYRVFAKRHPNMNPDGVQVLLVELLPQHIKTLSRIFCSRKETK